LTVALDGKNTGQAILAAAQTLACDLLVKGAFTQSRLRQMIFGGATQHVMTAATLPVLLTLEAIGARVSHLPCANSVSPL